jgi:hypothetical protein
MIEPSIKRCAAHLDSVAHQLAWIKRVLLESQQCLERTGRSLRDHQVFSEQSQSVISEAKSYLASVRVAR